MLPSADGRAFLICCLERPMPFGKQSGEGAALPVAPAETVKESGRRGGAARSPATGEDTARLDDDAHRAALAP